MKAVFNNTIDLVLEVYGEKAFQLWTAKETYGKVFTSHKLPACAAAPAVIAACRAHGWEQSH